MFYQMMKFDVDIKDHAFESNQRIVNISSSIVKKVGAYAFCGCENLTSVSLPAATVIGECAFGVFLGEVACKNLTSVSLPVATHIGRYAFSCCKSLTDVSLPVATHIGEGAFIGCESLTNITLPAATEIGIEAFRKCENLTSVSLSSVKCIDKRAFSDCENLIGKIIVLPDDVVVSEEAFPNGVRIIYPSKYKKKEIEPITEKLRSGGWMNIAASASQLDELEFEVLKLIVKPFSKEALQSLRRQAAFIVRYVAYDKTHILMEPARAKDEAFFDRVKTLHVPETDREFDVLLQECNSWPETPTLSSIMTRLMMKDYHYDETTIQKCLLYVWHYAMKQPHDPERFANAVSVYQHYAGIDGKLCLDCLLATIYKSELANDRSVIAVANDWVDYFLKRDEHQAIMNLFYGLLWIKAPQIEYNLLRKLPDSLIKEDETLGERLAYYRGIERSVKDELDRLADKVKQFSLRADDLDILKKRLSDMDPKECEMFTREQVHPFIRDYATSFAAEAKKYRFTEAFDGTCKLPSVLDTLPKTDYNESFTSDVQGEIIAPAVKEMVKGVVYSLHKGTYHEIADVPSMLSSLTGLNLDSDGRLEEFWKVAKHLKEYVYYNQARILSPGEYGVADRNALEEIKSLETPSGGLDRLKALKRRAALRIPVDYEQYKNFTLKASMDAIGECLLCGVTFAKTKGIVTYFSLVWHYAMKQPHDANSFTKAVEMYQHYAGIRYTDKWGEVHEILCVDCLLATLYKSALMGDGVLAEMRKLIDGWTDYFIEKKDSIALANLASGLKWIGDETKTSVAEKFECELLKKMASSAVSMSQELLDRILFIEKKAKIFAYAPEVKSAAKYKSEEILSIDNEARNWDEKRLLSFFETLDYQKKNLEYALTMDLWEQDEDIPIASGAGFDVETAYTNVEADIARDFGDEVIRKRRKAVFLLSVGQTEIEGKGLFLRRTIKGVPDYAGLYVIIVPIGLRKLTVQIYTLYLSQGKDALTEGQQALALKQNSDPVHGRIIRALRDMVQRSIWQTANPPPEIYSHVDEEQ